MTHAVSLFTREWIEIVCPSVLSIPLKVSLFTREWIEILCERFHSLNPISLPLYEGVD